MNDLDTAVDAESNLINVAVLFIKPHATKSSDIRNLVLSTLSTHKIRIERSGVLSGSTIDECSLIDDHYASIARYAMSVNISEIEFVKEVKEVFCREYQLCFDTMLKENGIISAKRAMELLQIIEANHFEELWRKNKTTRLTAGLYVAPMQIDGASFFVCNGFYPSLRAKFTREGSEVHWFVVSWEEAHLSWRDFRSSVVGSTNPETAFASSIRHLIWRQWEQLGLSQKPNVSDNGIHASAGPFEALRERMIWTGISDITSDAFGQALLRLQYSVSYVVRLLNNPFCIMEESSEIVPFFDIFEDVDTSVALNQMKKVRIVDEISPPNEDASIHQETSASGHQSLSNSTLTLRSPHVPNVLDVKKTGSVEVSSSVRLFANYPSDEGDAKIKICPALPCPSEHCVFGTHPLSVREQAKMQKNMNMLRVENELYLRSHPEIQKLVSDIWQFVFINLPQDPLLAIEKIVLSYTD